MGKVGVKCLVCQDIFSDHGNGEYIFRVGDS